MDLKEEKWATKFVEKWPELETAKSCEKLGKKWSQDMEGKRYLEAPKRVIVSPRPRCQNQNQSLRTAKQVANNNTILFLFYFDSKFYNALHILWRVSSW